MEFIQFMFGSGFWRFIGCFMVLSLVIVAPLKFVMFVYNRAFRHWNIRIHGYPPPNCDADGDFKTEEKP